MPPHNCITLHWQFGVVASGVELILVQSKWEDREDTPQALTSNQRIQTTLCTSMFAVGGLNIVTSSLCCRNLVGFGWLRGLGLQLSIAIRNISGNLQQPETCFSFYREPS